jgi:hypothetical protein
MTSIPESIAEARKLSHSTLIKLSKNDLLKLITLPSTGTSKSINVSNTSSSLEIDANNTVTLDKPVTVFEIELKSMIRSEIQRNFGELRNDVLHLINDMKKDLTHRFEDVDKQFVEISKLVSCKFDDINSKCVVIESACKKEFPVSISGNKPKINDNHGLIKSEARLYTAAVQSVQSEEKDREKKKKNIKIQGLSTQPNVTAKENVQTMVNSIISDRKITVIEVKRHIRPNKDDIVIASFTTNVDRNAVLAKARSLKESEKYKDTHLSPDWTREEQLEQYELRKEKKRLNNESVAQDPDFLDWYVVRGTRLIQLSHIRRRTDTATGLGANDQPQQRRSQDT